MSHEPIALGAALASFKALWSPRIVTQEQHGPGGATRGWVKLDRGVARRRRYDLVPLAVPEPKNGVGARPWYPRLSPPSTCLSVMSL